MLKPGGYAAISVTANPERSFYAPVRTAMARYMPRDPSSPAYRYVLGDAAYLRSVFVDAGFQEVETSVEMRQFPFATFATFFDPIERGVGHMGQEFIELPADVRLAVRADVQRALENVPGGPIQLPMEVAFGCGRN